MRVSVLVSSLVVVSGWDFSNLENRIHQTTLRFDQHADAIRIKEDSELDNIKLREVTVDRSLDEIRRKFHLDQPNSNSFLERKRGLSKRTVTVPKMMPLDKDIKVLEKTEDDREKAEKQFLAVERDIAEMPERILHSKRRMITQDMDVPLEAEEGVDEGVDGEDE